MTAARWRRHRARGRLVRLAARLSVVLVITLICFAPTFADPKFPPLTGRIVDEAGIISEPDRREILELLAALEQKSTDQIVVYTARSLQGYEIEDFGYRLGRFWAIGQKGKDNGIVLIVAPNERKVRIEVGRGLEPIMTDLMSGLIVRNVILPAFRRGEFSAGVKAGVRDIRDVLLGDAEEVKRRAGGGAKRTGGVDWMSVIIYGIMLIVILNIVWSFYRQFRGLPQAARHRSRRAGNTGAPVIVPSGSSGSWDGGSGSSGGSGWSGGGGSFGGGGSSGSW